MMAGEGVVIEEEMTGGEMIEGERIEEGMIESLVDDLEDDNREYTRRRHSSQKKENWMTKWVTILSAFLKDQMSLPLSWE